MPQLVFIHGPGAGACSDAYYHQLRHFKGSVAPNLPGHPDGASCTSVERYTEWLRGWLWAQGMTRDLVLVGYTLGGAIALQYGLDYPDEVKGIVAMTVAARPKVRAPGAGGHEMRLQAAKDPVVYEQWMAHMRNMLKFVEPELKERLIERHRQMGPMSQYHDGHVIDAFDVRDRIATLKPKLMLFRGMDDPGLPKDDYEQEIHEAVPGSTYIRLHGAGHFIVTDIPDKVNALIEDFMAGL